VIKIATGVILTDRSLSSTDSTVFFGLSAFGYALALRATDLRGAPVLAMMSKLSARNRLPAATSKTRSLARGRLFRPAQR
jgi:hypothetical protein